MDPDIGPNTRPRLSVAMIARDEQDYVGASIASVRTIADEIVVLDTGSVDATARVARQGGAKVVQAVWEDDFSAARNRVLDALTGDWILWLDAGERLLPDWTQQVRRFVDRQADPQHVYLLMVELPAAEPGGSAEQAAQARLMPAKRGLRFAGRVCESLEPSMQRLGITMDATCGRIVRHQRHQTEAVKACKARRDLRLIGMEEASGVGLSPRLWIARGEASMNLHEPAAARDAFLRGLEAAPHGSTEMLEAYYGLLTTFGKESAERERQLAVCLEALEIYPLDAQLLVAMGGYLQEQNRLDLAARAFQLAMKHGQVDVRTWHLVEIQQIAAVCFAAVLQLQGQREAARRAVEEAMASFPDSMRLRRCLLDLYVRAGCQEEALRAAEGLETDQAAREALRNAVCGACQAVRKNWTGALGYLQSAYVAGCRDPLCLRWLTLTLISTGQAEAARPVVSQWLQWEPGSAEARVFLDAIGPEASGEPGGGTLAAQEGLGPRFRRIDPAQPGPPGTTLEASVFDCIAPPSSAAEWVG